MLYTLRRETKSEEYCFHIYYFLPPALLYLPATGSVVIVSNMGSGAWQLQRGRLLECGYDEMKANTAVFIKI